MSIGFSFRQMWIISSMYDKMVKKPRTQYMLGTEPIPVSTSQAMTTVEQ